MTENKIEYTKHSFHCDFYEFKTNYEHNDKIINFLSKNKMKNNEKQFSTFFDNNQIIDHVDLDFFKKFISEQLLIFIVNFLNKKSFVYTGSWFQAYKPNDFHDCHIHGIELNEYSLIYYVNCTDESSVTAFYRPMHPYIGRSDEIYIKPEKSKLVIFPSYLPHSAWPNKDEERIIFSANIKVE